mmetsp:Transcript_133348/g.385954  ORF Transcript_133348/g.385954 Transcript_133348/m.385954 type:complete len:634 (-) Transcript_133348:388-2289(-)
MCFTVGLRCRRRRPRAGPSLHVRSSSGDLRRDRASLAVGGAAQHLACGAEHPGLAARRGAARLCAGVLHLAEAQVASRAIRHRRSRLEAIGRGARPAGDRGAMRCLDVVDEAQLAGARAVGPGDVEPRRLRPERREGGAVGPRAAVCRGTPGPGRSWPGLMVPCDRPAHPHGGAHACAGAPRAGEKHLALLDRELREHGGPAHRRLRSSAPRRRLGRRMGPRLRPRALRGDGRLRPRDLRAAVGGHLAGPWQRDFACVAASRRDAGRGHHSLVCLERADEHVAGERRSGGCGGRCRRSEGLSVGGDQRTAAGVEGGGECRSLRCEVRGDPRVCAKLLHRRRSVAHRDRAIRQRAGTGAVARPRGLAAGLLGHRPPVRGRRLLDHEAAGLPHPPGACCRMFDVAVAGAVAERAPLRHRCAPLRSRLAERGDSVAAALVPRPARLGAHARESRGVQRGDRRALGVADGLPGLGTRNLRVRLREQVRRAGHEPPRGDRPHPPRLPHGRSYGVAGAPRAGARARQRRHGHWRGHSHWFERCRYRGHGATHAGACGAGPFRASEARRASGGDRRPLGIVDAPVVRVLVPGRSEACAGRVGAHSADGLVLSRSYAGSYLFVGARRRFSYLGAGEHRPGL